MGERKSREKRNKKQKITINSEGFFSIKKLSKKGVLILIAIIVLLGIAIYGIVSNAQKNNGLLEIGDNQKDQEKYVWGQVQAKTKNTKNYTMVTSADGIQVPVPTGYTASSVANERYVGTTSETKTFYLANTITSFTSSGTYPWSKNSEGIWVSGNYNVNSSTSEMTTDSFTIGTKGGKVKINFSVSSEFNYDKLYGQVINTSTNSVVATVGNISGTSYGTTESSLTYVDADVNLEQGTYQLKIVYSKDSSGNTGLDKAYVKRVEVYTGENNGNETKITESIVKKTNEGGQNGFVIYEGTDAVTTSNQWEAQCNRNQYVWIPIADISDMYWLDQATGKRYGTLYSFTSSSYSKSSDKREPQMVNYDIQSTYLTQYLNGISRQDFLLKMETDFDEMLTSIATYGGFYIGRYQAGDLAQATPVVKRINSDIASQTWYTMWKKSPRLSTGGANVHMIWGTQWDQTLKWLIDSGNKTYSEVGSNSTSWGNYQNNSFTYYTNTSKSTATKNSGTSKRIPSGAYDGANANNVFDLAGNVWDWTCESNGSGTGFGRYSRGGNYNNGGGYYPAANRGGNNPYYSYNSVGLRCALYIK